MELFRPKRNESHPTAPPLGQFYDIHDHRLLLYQSGSGIPSVIFLPGAGLIGLDYLNIHDETSKLTTSVLYDRAGTGWSDNNVPLTRSAAAEELHSLLHRAGIPAPYLLVGHSLGALYTRSFAARYAAETAGMVLLDPAHEDSPEYTPTKRHGARVQILMLARALALLPRLRRFYRTRFEAMLASWPDPLREILVEYHLRTWRSSLHENKHMEGSLYDEARGSGVVPNNHTSIPFIILTARGLNAFEMALLPPALLRESNELKMTLYQRLVEDGPSGCGENRPVDDAGHTTIHTDRPDAVVQAIRDLVERYRSRVNGARSEIGRDGTAAKRRTARSRHKASFRNLCRRLVSG